MKLEFNNKNLIIQSMTNVKTCHVGEVLKQINDLKNAGCHLVRVAIFDDKDIKALNEVVKKSSLPIIADIHFNYLYALKAIDAGVAKIRLNPGNINKPEEINKIIEKAKTKEVWIRIGVNCGSLPQHILDKYNNQICADAMIETLKEYLILFEEKNFNKIVISLKASDPLLNVEVNEKAAQLFNYPIHVGVTEAGPLLDATINSCIGLIPLLQKKIPSTIRISISSDPIKEIEVIYKILNSLKIMHNRVQIISCPTCGRLSYDMFSVVNEIEQYCKNKHFPLKISILGCVVNGIGEGKNADIGICGSADKAILFEKGQIIKTLDSKSAIKELKLLIDKYYDSYLLKKQNNDF